MKTAWILSREEMREWRLLRKLSRKYKITVKRVGPAGVRFKRLPHTIQLGTGRALEIMRSRIKINKKMKVLGKPRRYR